MTEDDQQVESLDKTAQVRVDFQFPLIDCLPQRPEVVKRSFVTLYPAIKRCEHIQVFIGGNVIGFNSLTVINGRHLVEGTRFTKDQDM